MNSVAIIGASGFTGSELLRICADHPEIDVVVATGDSTSGSAVADIYPHLGGSYPDLELQRYTPELLDSVDLTFLALPHGQSQALMPDLLESSKRVVDLSGDFRFSDPAVYEEWYGAPHSHPELLGEFVFGLPELFRTELVGAGSIAVAGCYVTAAALALAPLVATGAVEGTGMVVDAASGVSGAGKSVTRATSFTAVDENFTAYGLVGHRHTPEIEMAVSRYADLPANLVFTPHLAPMNRGILATCYGRAAAGLTTEAALHCLASAYRDEPFVTVSERPPSTKDTMGSNNVHITARVDPRTGWALAISALDNLVKGAAGQAVQCANLSLGLDEATGLPANGMYP